MLWFILYDDAQGKEHVERFFSVEKALEWIQGYKNSTDEYPRALVIYKAECVFDGS